ncbi:hypothetical protein O181_024792 [Austropuccinia psidii MF-1]|uniref:DHHA2 domain-containing protein n=1 Tax=Austropuccinia psidii MF-1 TaxID=1389203 RepID=A0A9Q3CJZ2_9BASI|nr:hypothetical protein [Austropuccinia psidii MF-1]
MHLLTLTSWFSLIWFFYCIESRTWSEPHNQQVIFNSGETYTKFESSKVEDAGVLSRWASATKSQFLAEILENKADEWIIVMGNEAGDTDSMAAAIAWAYHLSNLKRNSQKAIPLLQTVADALDLRPENQLALQKSHMGPRHRDLLTIDELPIRAFELSLHLRGIALVDHNVPTPEWHHAPILSIIDHHADRKFNLSASPRVLETSASCCSLVADLILKSEDRGEHATIPGEKSGIPSDLVNLLLRAIALDSHGLGSASSREIDHLAVFGLFKLSQWHHPSGKPRDQSREKRQVRKIMKSFQHEMSEAQLQLEALDLRDLFRRDWKTSAVQTNSSRYPYLTIGFASIPYSMATQIQRTPEKTVPEWFAIERAFTAEIGADVSVVLTQAKSAITGHSEKEIVLVVAHGWGKRLSQAAATDLFKTLCRAVQSELEGLKDWIRPDNKPLLPRRMAWRLPNEGYHINRKILMPLILNAASDWTWDPPDSISGSNKQSLYVMST